MAGNVPNPELMIEISKFKNAFYTNLIKNPCGENNFDNWINVDRFEDFTIQDCDIGSKTTIDSKETDNIKKCFATQILQSLGGDLSKYDSCKIQVIDLHREGITQDFLDKYQPRIYLSEWFGRFDETKFCNEYSLHVFLFDSNFERIQRCACNHFFFGRIDSSEKNSFKKFEYVIKDYGKDVRYVVFMDGMFNGQVTDANVQLLYPNDAHLDSVNDVDRQVVSYRPGLSDQPATCSGYPVDHMACFDSNSCNSTAYNFLEDFDENYKNYFHAFEYVIKDYGKDVRYVIFMDGMFNGQVTDANVQLLYPNDAHLDSVNDVDRPVVSYRPGLSDKPARCSGYPVNHKACFDSNSCSSRAYKFLNDFDENYKNYFHAAIKKYQQNYL